MQDLISINGRFFNAAMTSIKRTHNITDGENAGRTAAPMADMIRDVIGTFLTYVVTFEVKNDDVEEYDALIDALIQPDDFIVLTVPYAQGSKTFQAYVTKVDDELKSNIHGVRRWGGCTVTFTARAPQWRPE